MRKVLVIWCFTVFIGVSQAQQPFLGVQNSTRKGMISSLMNPAEINNLSKKVEVNVFSFQAGLSNNVLSFGDVVNGNDLLDLTFNESEGPINFRMDLSFLGPSIGFRVKKWSFGLATQAFVKADFVDLDPNLARSVFEDDYGNYTALSPYSPPNLRILSTKEQQALAETRTTLNSPYNQRVSANAFMEIDLLVGREILTIGPHEFSAGANLRFLIPGAYANLGLNELRGVLVDDGEQIFLTDSRAELNISYSDAYLVDNFAHNLNFSSIGGFAVDLGGNYKWKKDGKPSFLNAGLAVRNLGGMTFTSGGQVNHTYSMNIPQNQRFRIDNLEGNLDEIEEQLVSSGFFSINRSTDNLKVNLPTMISAYAELQPAKIFQVSLFVQKRMADEGTNFTLTSQNIIALTPRLVLGKFEIYSPWAHYQVAGLTGGLGLQLGGFFLGSNSILTGSLANSTQVDAHMGFSFGVGR